MSANLQPLVNYLEQLQRKGETHIHLDKTARQVLREFFLVAKGIKKISSNDISPEKTPSTSLQINGKSAQQKIHSLSQQASGWAAAKEIGSLRTTCIFSAGNPEADIMFIADAPGYHEEAKGHPFAGPAGEKLDGILKAMGLNRNDVYITHLVKNRPSMPNQTTANRKPNAKEIAIFTPFLQAEINIVNPKIIVALGSVVAHHLLESDAEMEQLRGTFHNISTTHIPVIATYHPSYLLQTEAHADKRKIWEDMLAVMEKTSIPISEKQQQYFLPK